MAEHFNRTRLQDLYVESMMKVNPKYIDFVHSEMVRCARIITQHGILCNPGPRVVVTRKAQLQPVTFDSPNLIVVNFTCIQSIDLLQVNMREVMASYAMAVRFKQEQDYYKHVVNVSKVDKPVWNGYKSPKWLEALNWFAD